MDSVENVVIFSAHIYIIVYGGEKSYSALRFFSKLRRKLHFLPFSEFNIAFY